MNICVQKAVAYLGANYIYLKAVMCGESAINWDMYSWEESLIEKSSHRVQKQILKIILLSEEAIFSVL